MKRAIIVTGGSRGLGLSIVRGLLESGHAVATCSRTLGDTLPALLEAHPESLFWQAADIGDAASTQDFIQAAVQRFGAPWGLVNNAGIAREGILATLPLVEVDNLIQTNLTGAIQMARGVLRHMLSRPGGGRIINISSIIGQRGYTGLAAYGATKAGLDGLTRALAREVGRRQITVNSVAPGYLDTDMSGTLSGGQRDQIVRRTPMARLGTAADIVPTILFLLGDGARFITGQIITIDGGITC